MDNIFDKEKIKRIEDKYDYIHFRMAYTYLFEEGVRNLANENEVKEIIKHIQLNTPLNSIMTADFLIQIVKIANELAKVNVNELMEYVNKEMRFGEQSNNIVTIWENDLGVDEGEYSISDILDLIKENISNISVVEFLVDSLYGIEN